MLVAGETGSRHRHEPNALPCRALAALLVGLVSAGCYAPLHSPGVPASSLPDHFRIPIRTSGCPLNYATLVAPAPPVYVLGPGDVLEVTVPDLVSAGDARPLSVQVYETGDVHLPRVGVVSVGGVSLAEAQSRINAAVADGFLQNPGASVRLVEKGTASVVVLGAVKSPGVHVLPRLDADVAHALASAGGFAENAGDAIEVHRRLQGAAPQPVRAARESTAVGIAPASYRTGQRNASYPPEIQVQGPISAEFGHSFSERWGSPDGWQFDPSPLPVIRIPLRGQREACPNPFEVALGPGDVIVVPPRRDEVFYVVGPLSETNRTRFSVGDRDREIGNGFLLPPDREVDVVTAVAMAGYIDPINSPTTVTVHRTGPDGSPLLVRIDLIKARSDPRETILVQGGDIIYLNPDCCWYSRRMLDRVIDRALGTAVGRWLTN